MFKRRACASRLAGCRIGNQGAMSVSKSMGKNQTLEILAMGGEWAKRPLHMTMTMTMPMPIERYTQTGDMGPMYQFICNPHYYA